MPKTIPPETFDTLAALFAGRPEGLGLEAVLQGLGLGIARRTAQRRLAQLVALGRLEPRGEGPARRYRDVRQAQVASLVAEPTGTSYGTVDPPVPLTPEGAAIRAQVRLPRQQRMPAGYRHEMLEQYQPNHSFYLSQAVRADLHALGRAAVPEAPAGIFARELLSRLLIDLSWASSRLEGNTYSRLDTERLIQFGQAAEGKDAIETQMILNHKAAIEYLVNDPAHAVVDEGTVIALHALLSDGLMADPLACGRLRDRAVEIGGSVYLPLAVPQKLQELFGIVLAMAAEIHDPFEQAFFLMVHLPYLQPFEDVNKRVSRLAANIPFIRHNLSPLSFVDVPLDIYIEGLLGVYELAQPGLLRDVFVWAYARSCRQYVAVRRQLVPPDTLRLRYRNELAATVRVIVQGGHAADRAAIGAAVPAAVAAVDRERFIGMVINEFTHLHHGNVVRFGLRAMEFQAWQAGHGAQ